MVIARIPVVKAGSDILGIIRVGELCEELITRFCRTVVKAQYFKRKHKSMLYILE